MAIKVYVVRQAGHSRVETEGSANCKAMRVEGSSEVGSGQSSGAW